MLSNKDNKISADVDARQPLVYIVILNWNNGADTTECLESLRLLNYSNFVIVLIDNGSTDNSLSHIRAWALGEATAQSLHTNPEQQEPVELIEMSAADIMKAHTPVGRRASGNSFQVILIKSEQNLGFAKGSNLGIRFVLLQKADYVMLLNNDTVADPESLEVLVSFLESNKKYAAATPQIRHYSNRNKVDHCGGKLLWFGAKQYFFYNADVSALPQMGFQQITFISGCVVLFRSKLFHQAGLLSEQFFHGEEDFEFSWRLKKKKIYAACCFQSVIYHKISSTANKAFQKNSLGRVFNFYLNRYIDMRNYFYKFFWLIWRIVYLFYIIPMLMINYSFSLKTMLIFSKQLLKLSRNLNGVDRNLFEQFTKNNISL